MASLSQQILEHAARQPEGTPLLARTLLHLGKRAAIDQTLSRLQRRGQLLRVARGIYVLPVQTRFGSHAPGAARVIEGLARQRGETIVPHGAAAANALGLTPQVPTRAIYLTSGPDRKLQLGRQTVELRHAPAWQLLLPGQPAGEAVRALAWNGPPGSHPKSRDTAQPASACRTECACPCPGTAARLAGPENQQPPCGR